MSRIIRCSVWHGASPACYANPVSCISKRHHASSKQIPDLKSWWFETSILHCSCSTATELRSSATKSSKGQNQRRPGIALPSIKVSTNEPGMSFPNPKDFSLKTDLLTQKSPPSTSREVQGSSHPSLPSVKLSCSGGLRTSCSNSTTRLSIPPGRSLSVNPYSLCWKPINSNWTSLRIPSCREGLLLLVGLSAGRYGLYEGDRGAEEDEEG